MAKDNERYAFAQRLLHWLVAILVLGALAGGALLWAYGFEGLKASFGIEATNAIYKYHKTAGILVLGLMLIRLALRLLLGAPPPPATPVLGWAATAAGGFPVQFFELTLPGFVGENKALSETLFMLHGAVGLAIAALALLHIAAAMRHWLVLKDGVMNRIALP